MPPRRQTNIDDSSNPNIAQILHLLQQQTAMLAQHQQNPPPPPPKPVPVAFKAFQSVKPPEFKGTANPIEARGWLKEIERAFSLVKVEENQKTEYASYFLKAEANDW